MSGPAISELLAPNSDAQTRRVAFMQIIYTVYQIPYTQYRHDAQTRQSQKVIG
jgi:hypothetical protein